MQDIQDPARFFRDRPIKQPIQDFSDFTPVAQGCANDCANQRTIVTGQGPKSGVAGRDIQLAIERPFLVNDVAKNIGSHLACGKPRFSACSGAGLPEGFCLLFGRLVKAQSIHAPGPAVTAGIKIKRRRPVCRSRRIWS